MERKQSAMQARERHNRAVADSAVRPGEECYRPQLSVLWSGRYGYRTSGMLHHKNMAAGLCLQPSAWGRTEGIVDDVHISDVVMHDVGTPLHIAAKSPSTIGNVTIDRLSATGVYRAAASIESWAEEPIARVELRDSNIQFTGGFGPILVDPAEAAVAFMTEQSEEVKPPGENARPLPAWGLYARNVTSLNLSDVRLDVLKKDERPAIILDGVDRLDIDNLRWPRETRRSMVLKDVRRITQSGPRIPVVEATCLSLTASPDCKTITAKMQSGQSGLAKIGRSWTAAPRRDGHGSSPTKKLTSSSPVCRSSIASSDTRSPAARSVQT